MPTSLATPNNAAAFSADMPALLLNEPSAFVDEVTRCNETLRAR
jgi:hypothetical protein